MDVQVADLCDEFIGEIQIAEPIFKSFGAKAAFGGQVSVVKVFEDNVLVKKRLQQEKGDGRVLVVDGGGSTGCALMGDKVAGIARDNGWAGLIIYGCIRDSVEVAEVPIGVIALETRPNKSNKEGKGDYDVQVSFAGATFNSGDYVYVDPDGLIVAERDLLASR
jgi:regulator of ribonuclease activity A